MLGRKNPQDLMKPYPHKQRKFMPTIIGILAGLLVVIGIVIIVLWLTGGGFNLNIFKRKPTPTSTLPPTPVLSPTPSLPPTETLEPTETVAPTPSGPFEYEVQEFDNCWEIANRFDVELDALLVINNFEGGTCPIYAGQIITVPAPGTTLPTTTPVPDDLAKGTKISYTVKTGDSLLTIASEFNSTVEDIIALNDFDDPNNIAPGSIITVRVNLVTPTPTFAPTSTPAQ
jgi:LysM repeat protein